jgi:acyl-coenzyme A thioesterase PaaI-like protein
MSPNSLQRAQLFLSYLVPGADCHGFDNRSMRHLHIVQASAGHVLCTFQVAEESLNNHGSLHGGCIGANSAGQA